MWQSIRRDLINSLACLPAGSLTEMPLDKDWILDFCIWACLQNILFGLRIRGHTSDIFARWFSPEPWSLFVVEFRLFTDKRGIKIYLVEELAIT